jgi:hypothetical protein
VRHRRGIASGATPLTKFSYVISSMKGDTIDRIIDLARNPPTTGAYGILKARLLEVFGRTPVERALIDWPEMGNLKLLALYDRMAATLPDGADRDHILMKTLFMRQLPPDVRNYLADKIGKTRREIATAADCFFASSGTRQNPSSGMVSAAYKSYQSYLMHQEHQPHVDAMSQRTQGGHQQ